MATVTPIRTLSDLLEDLGGIPLDRVLLDPPPGTATEQHLIDLDANGGPPCELVDGVLVEKAMGYRESILAMAVGDHLRNVVVPRNLGFVSGADGMMRLFPGLIRIPDVAFASWDRFPGGVLPPDPIADLAPDLAVEVLGQSNTPAEMRRKRQEYFDSGVRLVWFVDHEQRTVTVYRSFDDYVTLDETGTLDGGDVLPGFELPLAELFAELDRQAGSK